MTPSPPLSLSIARHNFTSLPTTWIAYVLQLATAYDCPLSQMSPPILHLVNPWRFNASLETQGWHSFLQKAIPDLSQVAVHGTFPVPLLHLVLTLHLYLLPDFSEQLTYIFSYNCLPHWTVNFLKPKVVSFSWCTQHLAHSRYSIYIYWNEKIIITSKI